jgi:hypothetical protein
MFERGGGAHAGRSLGHAATPTASSLHPPSLKITFPRLVKRMRNAIDIHNLKLSSSSSSRTCSPSPPPPHLSPLHPVTSAHTCNSHSATSVWVTRGMLCSVSVPVT